MVGTRLAKELTEFSGELSLEGLHFWKTVFSAMTHPATTITSSSQDRETEASEASKEQAKLDPSSSDKKVIFLPCKNPPSRERVQLWLEARKQYESLQKRRKDTGQLKTGVVGGVERNPERTEQPGASSCPAVKIELCGRLSSVKTQRRKKCNLSLVISPMKNTGSHCKSTEVSPVSDEGGIDIKQEGGEKDDDDDSAAPPESPELPPWQQSCPHSPSGPDLLSENRQSETSVEPLSPRLSNSLEKLGENLSPSHVSKGEEGRTSPLLAHSTPFLRRRWRSKGDLEPLCSTPISEGKKLAVSFCLESLTVIYNVSFHRHSLFVLFLTCVNLLYPLLLAWLLNFTSFSYSCCRGSRFSKTAAEEEKPGRPTEKSVTDHTDEGPTTSFYDF